MATKKSKLRSDQTTTSVPLKIAQFEQELMAGILTQALALKILKDSSRPASELLKELMDIEVEVGRFISNIFAVDMGKGSLESYAGTLSGTLSFVSRFNNKCEMVCAKNKYKGKSKAPI